MIGIYAIKNKINNKLYIGQSIDIKTRWNKHLYLLNITKSDSRHLQLSWDKYGEHNFELLILEEIKDKNYLNEREIYWISKYKSNERDFGYNISGGGGNILPSKETLDKMSESLKETWKTTKHPRIGKKHSRETKNKISISKKGKTLSEETKNKISAKLSLCRHSEETKNKISKSNTGKVFSEETKRKISESKKGKPSLNKGRKMSDEFCKKMSEINKGKTPWNKGRKWSNETKNKISESKKGKSSWVKIKEEEYKFILERFHNGENKVSIAISYNVTPQTIHNIIKKADI